MSEIIRNPEEHTRKYPILDIARISEIMADKGKEELSALIEYPYDNLIPLLKKTSEVLFPNSKELEGIEVEEIGAWQTNLEGELNNPDIPNEVKTILKKFLNEVEVYRKKIVHFIG